MSEEIIKQEEAQDTAIVSSIEGKSREDRIRIYNATANAEKLDDHLSESLQITDVVMYPTTYHDTVTGKDEQLTRIVLIDADKKAYACTSVGVASALQRMISLVGKPTWEPPLPVKAVMQKGNNGYKFMTLIIEE